jgi:spermidine synthase
MTTQFLVESLYAGYGQSFAVTNTLFELETPFQKLVIIENPVLGRVLFLDGIVQTTEKDEFIYHEMLTHVPMMSHPHPKRVLIIGGGDGGILREVLKHSCVEQVTLVEIDPAVIDMAKEYFPQHSQGAFEHPKANILIGDGVQFVNETQEKFDVIISDSTDPYGPAEQLFSADFYTAVTNCLTDDGVFVAQNGVPFFQLTELQDTMHRFKPLFADYTCFTVAVPTYIGGMMALAWGAKDITNRLSSFSQLKQRQEKRGVATRYYNPSLHLASFALPLYVQVELDLIHIGN